MANININNLPAKVDMKDLSTLLGLGGALEESNLNEILLAARCNELPIYFDVDIFGVKESDGAEPFGDKYGITQVMLNGLGVQASAGQRKVLTRGEPVGREIAVFAYEFNSEIFLPAIDDHVATFLDLTLIQSRDFYCDKVELDTSGLLPNTSRPTKKKPNILERREQALKIWLAAKSGANIEDDSQYQACYEGIGEPTQDILWDLLQIVDNELFARGKYEFFKNQGIIQFKTGTGEGRPSIK